MANLLGKSFSATNDRVFRPFFSEVSKGDEIMPAIKTLKLLAHGTSNTQKNLSEKSKLSRLFPSKSSEKLDFDQTDSGDA